MGAREGPRHTTQGIRPARQSPASQRRGASCPDPESSRSVMRYHQHHGVGLDIPKARGYGGWRPTRRSHSVPRERIPATTPRDIRTHGPPPAPEGLKKCLPQPVEDGAAGSHYARVHGSCRPLYSTGSTGSRWPVIVLSCTRRSPRCCRWIVPSTYTRERTTLPRQ